MERLGELNLNHLYYFWVIAREGSIRKAAQRIHLTQPTLSDQLKSLELRLGHQLFERSGNRMHLTKFGIKTLEHCDIIFNEGAKILEKLKSQEEKLIQVKVGILPDISKNLVCDFLNPVINAKKAFLSIEETEYKYLLQGLKLGSFDFIIVNKKDESLGRNFTQTIISENKFLAVCSKKTKKRMPFEKLVETVSYIAYTKESSLYLPIQDYFKKKKLSLSALCEVDDIGLVKLFTLSSESFSILPESVVRDEIRSGQLVILEEIPELKSALTLISKQTLQSKKILSLF